MLSGKIGNRTHECEVLVQVLVQVLVLVRDCATQRSCDVHMQLARGCRGK